MHGKTWIITVAFVVSIVSYNLGPMLPTYHYNKVDRDPVMIGQALFILLLATFILIHFKHKFIAVVLFGCAVNNMADELFFNPYMFQLNEYVLGLVLIISAYARHMIRSLKAA